jgi:hypothetical protein
VKANQRTDFKFSRHIQLWLCLAAMLLLVSCAAPTMRNQFRNYNEAYADSLNQQMLLNLARLENGHPAYYLAIGLIDAKYTFSSQTAAGATGGYTDAKTTTGNTPFINGSPSSIAGFPGRVLSTVLTTVFGYNLNETATVSSNPEFQFIPINNEVAARQVLEPISTDVFLQLYEQGYPIDQLLRIMIERIETPRLQSGEQLVLVNSPTCGTPEYYERFLRACAILRTLQIHGYLSLEAGNKPEKIGTVSFSQSGQSDPNGTNSASREVSGSSAKGNNSDPTPKDFYDAEDKGMILTKDNKEGWQLNRQRAVPQFFLRGAQEVAGTNFETLPEFLTLSSPSIFTNLSDEQQKAVTNFKNLVSATMEFLKTNQTTLGIDDYKTNDDEAITNVVMALSLGISIQTDVSNSDNKATRLVLRSFNRTMEAVASEQVGFEALGKSDINFAIVVPDFERRPILQMMWTNKPTALVPPLETVYYARKTYQITDPVVDPLNPGATLNPTATWNRDVFRLLVDLSSQVTVDISKFQRQVLELSQ